ncbi:hypothetical protein S7711_07844 [Stachybotrys chartarum IBT 7711]|uniref:Centromere protein H C-terminal domain-containing protein n=1 Tax=Stachybotrys chartarum (strain CBS 109288 / IBT 7711) TaxID=1280523 RepID=A0A084AXM8_STACB|nr:hypothetical protein S7711_07844 [Stachybotrys chartarum IBT 7711]
MEGHRDQDMDYVPHDEAYLPLSEDEQKILALYDKLQELRLEIAIINAQQSRKNSQSITPGALGDPLLMPRSPPVDAPNAVTEERVKTAQNDLLEARAKYALRNNAVEAVLMANPILKAVHVGTEASPVERRVLQHDSDLLPYVERRDETSKTVMQHSTDVGQLRAELTKVQSETIRVACTNVELAAEVIALAEQVQQTKTGHVEDAATRADLAQLEADVKASQRRWRIMKGVASGIVAGSGIDWARDDELCSIVLGPEDEFE